tara:strand:+ start:348 stop:503 length:156 start_codon:yes stop_codon:yes gene_type:complete
MKHANVLAILYFVAGYFATLTMLFSGQLYVQSLGGFLGIYITYLLVEQIES